MWAIVILVALVVIVAALYAGSNVEGPTGSNPPKTFDPANATYRIDGAPVTLVEGRSSAAAAPGSATQVTTSIFGEPVSGDLNGDGTPDAAMVIVQNPGGSGTFYYVVAAINASNVAEGTNAVLLGDRIAPQTISIENGQIVVNYAERKPSEPMSSPPSIGVTKYLTITGTSTLAAVNKVTGPGAN